MHKIEQYILKFGGMIMGLWVLIGSLLYFFVPETLFKMLQFTTLSIYAYILFGGCMYFLTKKGFSYLVKTGLEPPEKKEKEN
ncbi:MAG: hypothetical protein ACFFDN_00205 [Candidatus Hodarchaeota archaeon]